MSYYAKRGSKFKSESGINQQGELLVGNGTSVDYLNPLTGLNGYLLTRDTSNNLGISWKSIALNSTSINRTALGYNAICDDDNSFQL